MFKLFSAVMDLCTICELSAQCVVPPRMQSALDLPMAMRYRNLQKTYKQHVGVFQSGIHGLGLYCIREIEPGEMVIEYAGTVIRSVLTDKREKLYESKVCVSCVCVCGRGGGLCVCVGVGVCVCVCVDTCSLRIPSVHFSRVLDVTCSASTRMKWWMQPCQATRLDSSTTPVR